MNKLLSKYTQNKIVQRKSLHVKIMYKKKLRVLIKNFEKKHKIKVILIPKPIKPIKPINKI